MKPDVFLLPADLSFERAWQCFRHEAAVTFLDSRPGYGSMGRYSIIALDPWLSIRSGPAGSTVNGRAVKEDAFALLDRILSENRNQPLPGLPLSGGAIGSIAYDAGFQMNHLTIPDRAVKAADEGFPWINFDFYDSFLCFDQICGAGSLIQMGQLKDPARRYDEIMKHLDQDPVPGRAAHSSRSTITRFNVPDAADYMGRVEAVREHIRQGDVYIANMTHLFEASCSLPGDQLYEDLRRINPAPFAAFVRSGDLEILSSSPERLLSIDAAGHLQTRPIKGTRARNPDPVQDEILKQALLSSGKDRAELLMITDLERNDLSRVCTPGSVRVENLFSLEAYPQVFHLSSTVEGDLAAGITPLQALLACFPGGSISGAPKESAMSILDRLETSARSLYTGCLGYLSFDGQADFSILIRTAFRSGSKICYGAGGGITWESDPLAEYDEMLLKAQAFKLLIDKE